MEHFENGNVGETKWISLETTRGLVRQHCQLLCATVDMVNDNDYDLVSDSLL
jgi:hypothetical protein